MTWDKAGPIGAPQQCYLLHLLTLLGTQPGSLDTRPVECRRGAENRQWPVQDWGWFTHTFGSLEPCQVWGSEQGRDCPKATATEWQCQIWAWASEGPFFFSSFDEGEQEMWPAGVICPLPEALHLHMVGVELEWSPRGLCLYRILDATWTLESSFAVPLWKNWKSYLWYSVIIRTCTMLIKYYTQ